MTLPVDGKSEICRGESPFKFVVWIYNQSGETTFREQLQIDKEIHPVLL